MKCFLVMVFSLLLITIVLGGLVFADNEKITIYISGPQQMIATIEKKFEEKHGDVLNVFNTDSGPLMQKVWTEMAAGCIQADIIWGAEPIMYCSLHNKGVLQQYISPRVKQLQKDYQYGDGYYTAVNARYGVIVYNANRIQKSEIPNTWKDLTQKYWDGKLVMADASQSAMARALAWGLYDVSGKNWDLLKAYNTNRLLLTKTNEEAIAKVQSGEAWAGIAPHDGILRLINNAKQKGVNSPLRIAWPVDGAISVQRQIAIVKKDRSDKTEELVKNFIDYSLSEQVQQIASKFGFISVQNGVPLPDGVPETVKANPVDWEYASKHEAKFQEEFNQIMTAK